MATSHWPACNVQRCAVFPHPCLFLQQISLHGSSWLETISNELKQQPVLNSPSHLSYPTHVSRHPSVGPALELYLFWIWPAVVECGAMVFVLYMWRSLKRLLKNALQKLKDHFFRHSFHSASGALFSLALIRKLYDTKQNSWVSVFTNLQVMSSDCGLAGRPLRCPSRDELVWIIHGFTTIQGALQYEGTE